MKTLEEIENLSLEELECKASVQPAPAPAGLQRRIRETLAAQEFSAGEAPARPVRWAPYAALAAVAAAATLLITLPGRTPRDTFDDPYLAYAEVEKAFQTISDKMSGGLDLATRQTQAVAGKPQSILDKIQSK